MKYDEVLEILQKNSDANIVRRMQMIGLDPSKAFSGGDWRKCDFSNTNLKMFDMRNADFRGAIFAGSDVSFADFRNSDVDEGLSAANGYESIIIDRNEKLKIDKIRSAISHPICRIYKSLGQKAVTAYDDIVRTSMILYGNIESNKNSKFDINFKDVTLEGFIIFNIFEYTNNNFNPSLSSSMILDLMKSYNDSGKTIENMDLMPAIESIKHIRFEKFSKIIWPIFKKIHSINDYYAQLIDGNWMKYNDSELCRYIFDTFKSKHQGIRKIA